MARTDAHTPYWVKLVQEGVEDHDHRYGVCDFEEDGLLAYHHQTWRVGRNHTYKKCKKYVKYVVACRHIYKERERFVGPDSSTVEKAITSKRHEADVWKGEELLRDRPPLPDCSKTSCYATFVLKNGFDYGSYEGREASWRYRPSAYTTYKFVDKHLAEHVYSIYLLDEAIPCACDDFPPRSFPTCDRTTPAGVRYKGYSYFCKCGWCTPPMPNRGAVKQALKRLTRQNFAELDEDDLLDFEDVYKGRDYRHPSQG